jgi:hypothetical protein
MGSDVGRKKGCVPPSLAFSTNCSLLLGLGWILVQVCRPDGLLGGGVGVFPLLT